MMVLIHIDWGGTIKELEKLDDSYKTWAEKTDGVKYVGRFSPTGLKWHWTYFFKAESMVKWSKGISSWDYDRDYSKMTHGIVQFYQ